MTGLAGIYLLREAKNTLKRHLHFDTKFLKTLRKNRNQKTIFALLLRN